MPVCWLTASLTASRPTVNFRLQAEPPPGGDAVERKVRCLRCLLLSEKASSHCLIGGQVWATKDVIGRASRILRQQRESSGAAFFSCWPGLKKHLRQPVLYRVDHPIVAVVLFGIRVPSFVPVLMTEQVIPQHPYIPYGQA